MTSPTQNATCLPPRLRPFGQGDVPAILAQFNDPRVTQWLAALRQPFDIDEAEEFLTFAADPAQHVRALELDGDVIGGLSLGDALWYWLTPEYWGQGHMAGALRAALADHFADPVAPLTATCREDNAASVAVLQRLGFSARPEMRRMFFHGAGSSFACRDYLMTPEQWHVLNPPRLNRWPICLRPSRQADLATVQRLQQGLLSGGIWPGQNEREVRQFIETYRYRGVGLALWIIEVEERSPVGMALAGIGEPTLCFSEAVDQDRYLAEVLRLLRG